MAAALSPELLQVIRAQVHHDLMEDPLFHGGAHHARGLQSNFMSGEDTSNLAGHHVLTGDPQHPTATQIYDGGFASADSANVFWLLICGSMVFMMQVSRLCAP